MEQISTETPANVSVVAEKELKQLPGVNLDDRLRLVPGFSLFRRTSSLVANPTTQGISLRGIGSSGASRTLVMWDGVPINDPFGGWVYWTRIDPEEISQVEVSRGATTSVFGDRALSGAVGVFTRKAERYRYHLGYEGGTQDTNSVSAGVGTTWTRWSAYANARAFRTDGYYLVPRPLRGAIDQRAGVRFVAADTRADYTGIFNRLWLKFDVLAEQRENGTSLQENSTGLGNVAVHYALDLPSSELSLLAYHTREQFHASFSSIAGNRNTETLTIRQRVPAEATGGALLYQHNARVYHVTTGADFQRTSGTSIDALAAGGERRGGGTIFGRGIFLQSDYVRGPVRLFVGARQQYTDAQKNFFAPSGGMVVGQRRWRARAAGYRSFRVPTLNELYREFRQGNTNTLANPNLRPETLTGAEVGLDYVGERSRVSVTAYRNALSGLVTNVTLSSTPALITRQRQNAADSLSRGIEVQMRREFGSWLTELNYLYASSRYETGERIPQVPRHQGSALLSYSRHGFLFSGNVRSYSSQFDDDRNQFLLPGFATLQLQARQNLSRAISVYVMAENALDRQFVVAYTPIANTGNPRLVRVGVRLDTGALRRP